MIKKLLKSFVFILPVLALLIYTIALGISDSEQVNTSFCIFALFVLYSVYHFIVSIWELRKPVIKNNIQKFFLKVAYLACYGAWGLAIYLCGVALFELLR